MIDFNKKIKNSDKFRQPALNFISTGSYCAYPKGTTEYYSFWDQEVEKCIYGYTAEDGDFITGYHYFYLNYCPIVRQVYREVTNRKTGLKEWKSVRIKDIIKILQKSDIQASEGLDEGKFPFYTSSQILNKWINTCLYKGNAITMATGGFASVNYSDVDFSTSTDCFNFTCGYIACQWNKRYHLC